MSFSKVTPSSNQNHYDVQLNHVSNPKEKVLENSQNLLQMKMNQLWQRFNEWRSGTNESLTGVKKEKSTIINSLKQKPAITSEKKESEEAAKTTETTSGRWKMGLALGAVGLLGLSTLALYQTYQPMVNPGESFDNPKDTLTNSRSKLDSPSNLTSNPLDIPTHFTDTPDITNPNDYSSAQIAALIVGGGFLASGLAAGGLFAYRYFNQRDIDTKPTKIDTAQGITEGKDKKKQCFRKKDD